MRSDEIDSERSRSQLSDMDHFDRDANVIDHKAAHVLLLHQLISKSRVNASVLDSDMDPPTMDTNDCFTMTLHTVSDDSLGRPVLTPPSTPKIKTIGQFSTTRPVAQIHRRRSSSDFCFDIKNIELDITDAELLGQGLWSKVYKLSPFLPSSVQSIYTPPSPPSRYGASLTPPATPQKTITTFQAPRAFAIKVATRDDAIPVFESEARILQHLQTDRLASETHIIPFYGFSSRSKALIFECANHGTLEDLIALAPSRSAPETLALFNTIAPQLVAGLQFLHSKGVVHADIKPANVLLDLHDSTNTLHARFADFSASFLCADFGALVLPQQAGAFGGTWTYMAPEQLSRDPTMSTPTFASDVYSLGVTLLSLLGGGNPFEAETSNLFRLREAVKMGDVVDFAVREPVFEMRLESVERERKMAGAPGVLASLKLALRKKREDRCSALEWMVLMR